MFRLQDHRLPNIVTLLSLTIAISMVMQLLSPVIVRAEPTELGTPNLTISESNLLYRTTVSASTSVQWVRLDQLHVTVLDSGEDWATLVVDAAQLSSLARLGLRPNQTNELSALVAANAKAQPSVALALQTVLDQAAELMQQQVRGAAVDTSVLLTELAEISAETRASLSALNALDSDNDGLTDTEEGWWCTDPNNPNSDGDVDGYTDGVEINALLDFTIPRQIRWGYGTPFGPPNAWPDFNGADGDPNTPACNDGDRDTIPDQAEAFMVGSRVPAESTDGDKFDDGQELFGVTYCTGGVTSCGYGNYPRIEYWNYIKETMPNWVQQPGDNLFVAAFPKPSVTIDPTSWTVERVTTITTEEGQMARESSNYETSTSIGQSSSIANTVNWNEWEELSESVEVPVGWSDRMVVSPDGTELAIVNDANTTYQDGEDWVEWTEETNARLVSVDDKEFVILAYPDGRRVMLAVNWGKFIGGSTQIAGGVVALGAGCLASAATLGASCVAGVATGLPAIGKGIVDLSGAFPPDEAQNELEINQYTSVYNNVSADAEANATAIVNQEFDFQGVVNSLDGINYTLNRQNQVLAQGFNDISYQLARPRQTTTSTSGRSWGGAQTTTHEEYEEHSITEGQAFTTGQNWSTAWAVDSSHAANLTFSYSISNLGTEYARAIKDVIINIYLGDDATPLVSYAAWEQFSNGALENVFPDDSHTFASNPIPLTLEQMKRIDLGEKLRVVLEDYSYGADELFYQDAINGGLTVYVEDGVEDGDGTVDQYVMAAWGNDTTQDVLTRYFPSQVDEAGNLLSLQTPEFDGINPPSWNEHLLSDIAWWNIYQSCSADCATTGATPLHQQQVEQGGSILFRFNRDSDRDGYKDSVELRYGTDKLDPTSHPQPEVLAGYVSSREGDTVTVLLKMANFGTFDTYGIDSVMVASDDTISIGNNTIGGNGRVRANSQVAIGSLILQPDLTDWSSANNAAKPYATGNFTGLNDTHYTFTVQTAGVVGQGSTALQWTNGTISGTLDFGSSYHAPLPVEVADGVSIGVDSGIFATNNSFIVQAVTPRDTFTYTVDSEPFTPPTIIVSYSDPQGSHKFVTPVELASLDEDLTPHRGKMQSPVGLEIVTREEFNASSSATTDFVLNNPTEQTLTNARLYLNFISDGQLVAEMPFTLTVPTGPSVQTVTWSPNDFGAAYNPAGDNILLAFWADYQDNILDSAARPLNTFQSDPTAELVVLGGAANRSSSWNFGTVPQGAVVGYNLTLANRGHAPLRIVTDAPNLTLHEVITPSNITSHQLLLDTTQLPVGEYNRTVTIRSNDIDQPIETIRISGNVEAANVNIPASDIVRPLDYTVTITGSHAQGEWVQFTHPLGPDTQTLHPVFVYGPDYETQFGAGRYATDHATGKFASSEMFGSGLDRDLVVESGEIVYVDQVRASLTASISSGQNVITIASTAGFSNRDEVLIIVSQGNQVGMYELATIHQIIDGSTITLESATSKAFNVSGAQIQVVRVPHYKNVTVKSGGTLTASEWNGSTGGIVVFRATGQVQIDEGGVLTTEGRGYRSATYHTRGASVQQYQGEGQIGVGGRSSNSNGAGAGGGRNETGDDAYNIKAAGGGGGATSGQNSAEGFGKGGSAFGGSDLSNFLFFGGAGGVGGGDWKRSGSYPKEFSRAGNGGGAMLIFANQLVVQGQLNADGEDGYAWSQYEWSTRGGGAGGSIYLTVSDASIDTNFVTAAGGVSMGERDDRSGSGGVGRVSIAYCNSLSGSTSPPATLETLECHSVEQIESPPYNSMQFLLPESSHQDLVGYWSFDHGTAIDASGNDHHGTVSGATPVAGRIGNAFRFDGIDDYIEVPNAGGVFDLVNEWTLSAWVRPDANEVDIRSNPIIWKVATAGLNDDTFFLTHGLEDVFAASLEEPSVGGHIVFSQSHDAQQWSHVLATYDGEYLYIYVNGLLEGSLHVGQAVAHTGVAPLRIGNILHTNHGNAGVFNGIIDEVAIFKSAFTPTEVEQFFEYQQSQGVPQQQYVVQFGRRIEFDSASEHTVTLRIPASNYAVATLDTLVSGVGSGDTAIQLDVGSNGVWDWQATQTITNAASIASGDLASAFRSYWVSQGAPLTGTLDVPVRMSMSEPGQVLLTNLVMQPLGSTLRTVTFVPELYDEVQLTLGLTGSGSGYVVSADIGDDGTIDWTESGDGAIPASVTTSNLASAVNAATAQFGRTVPIRFFVSGGIDLSVDSMESTLNAATDASIVAGDITFSNSSPTEGDLVTISAIIRNSTGRDFEPTMVAFVAEVPDWGEWYLGSQLLATVPAHSSAIVSLDWGTLGFVGDIPIRVVIDPAGQVAESNENNNEAAATLKVLTRPDLQISTLAPATPPRQAMTTSINIVLANLGETPAPTQVALYEGNPAVGGVLAGTAIATVAAQDTTTATVAWVPSRLGQIDLYAVVDSADSVIESDETNNSGMQSMQVSWGAPLIINAGSDAAYHPADGYGYLTGGSAQECGGGSLEQTYREGTNGVGLSYRIDNLHPDQFYHADITFFVCQGSRAMQISADATTYNDIIVVDQTPQTVSFLLSPTDYVDGSVVINAEKVSSGLGGAVLSAIRLTDVHYCYRDSGAADEVSYAASADQCGWLNGSAHPGWGTLPHQTVRFHNGVLQYRADQLDSAKQYAAHLTFFEGDGQNRTQSVAIDGVVVASNIQLSATPQTVSLNIPSAALADGTVTISIDGGNESLISEFALQEITVSAAEPATPPAAPTGVQASDDASTEYVRITWNASNDAEQYHVYRNTVDDSSGRQQLDSTTATTFDDTSATPEETYYYWVTASNADGTSAFSASDAGSRAAVDNNTPHFTNCAENTGNNATLLVFDTVSTNITLESGDEIAIFSPDGSICAGVATWNGNSLPIAVWGNNSQTPQIDGLRTDEAFRIVIWDASEGVEYQQVVATYTAGDGHYAGNSIHTISALTAVTTVDFPLVLNDGWSMASLPITPDDGAMSTIFGPLGSQLKLVKDNRARVYWPEYGIDQLGSWDITTGYQVYIDGAATITVTGTPIDPSAQSIALPSGWSIIPVWSLQPINIEQALASLSDKIVIVKDNAARVYWPEYGIDQIHNLVPGQAYQIYLSAEGELTFPATRTAVAQTSSNRVERLADCVGQTGNNATIAFPVSTIDFKGMRPAVGDEIMAFDEAGSTCVGYAVWSDSAFPLAIWGDNPLTEEVDGLQAGELFQLRMRSELGKEYHLTVTYLNDDAASYAENSIAAVDTLTVHVASNVSLADLNLESAGALPIGMLVGTMLALLATSWFLIRKRQINHS